MEYGESIKRTVTVCLPNLWCSEFLNISEMCFLKFFQCLFAYKFLICNISLIVIYCT